jgi:DNA integrity scanning protein DisA with diadenylate cyclase activity
LEELIKIKTLKKYSTQLFFVGNRILQPEFPDNVDFKTFVLNDLCSVCDKISSWKIKEEFSFQINNSINTCKTYLGLDSFAVDKKLNELLKRNESNSDILIYKPKNKNSIKFNGIPEILEKSSKINFSISLNAKHDINAKVGLQILNEE